MVNADRLLMLDWVFFLAWGFHSCHDVTYDYWVLRRFTRVCRYRSIETVHIIYLGRCKHPDCNYETHFSENLNKHKRIHLNNHQSSKCKSNNLHATSGKNKRRKISNLPSATISATGHDQVEQTPYTSQVTTTTMHCADAGVVKPPANIQQILNQAYSLSSGVNSTGQYGGVVMPPHTVETQSMSDSQAGQRVLVMPLSQTATASDQHKHVVTLDHVTNATSHEQEPLYQCEQQHQFDTTEINNSSSRQYLSLWFLIKFLHGKKTMAAVSSAQSLFSNTRFNDACSIFSVFVCDKFYSQIVVSYHHWQPQCLWLSLYGIKIYGSIHLLTGYNVDMNDFLYMWTCWIFFM